MKLFNIVHINKKERSAFVSKVQPAHIKVLKELEKHHGTYIFQEHNEKNAHQIHLDVQVDGASRITLSCVTGAQFSHSKNHEDLWYLDPHPARESFFKECGKFLIKVYDANGNLLEKETIIALPHTLSITHYLSLQHEVRDLLTRFEMDQGYFNRPNSNTEQLEAAKVQSLFDEFQLSVGNQEKMPVTSTKEPLDHTTSVDTMAHAVEQLLEHRHQIISLSQHRLDREVKLRRETAELRRPGADRGITTAIHEKLNSLEQNSQSAEETMKLLRQMIDHMHSLQSRGHMSAEGLPRNDSTPGSLETEQHQKIIHLYNEMVQLWPPPSSETESFITRILDSSQLFEIWTLLQLYSECIRLKFLPRTPIMQRLQEHLKKHKSLSGVAIQFEHYKTQDRLIVVFSPQIQLSNHEIRRPDLVVTFVNARKKSHQHHTLQIRHLPYQNPHYAYLLRHHLMGSRNRFIHDLAGTAYEMTSTSLIHSASMANWNIELEESPLYSHAHFHVTPDQTNHLKTYLSRILHQYNGNSDYCPSCGSIQIGTPYPSRKRAYKWTYVCACGEVWGSYLCKNSYDEEYHNEQTKKTQVTKYMFGNYNPLSSENWDVYCPTCHRNQEGDMFLQNMSGERIELQF